MTNRYVGQEIWEQLSLVTQCDMVRCGEKQLVFQARLDQLVTITRTVDVK